MKWDFLEQAISNQEWEDALEAAANGWRLRRHAILADLIDELASRTSSDALLRPSDYKQFHATWLARAKSATAIDLDVLLASLSRSLPQPEQYYWYAGSAGARFASWLERLTALAKINDDPRTATALFEILRKSSFPIAFDVDGATIYDPVIDALIRIADERVLDPLRRLHEMPIASRQGVRQYLANALPRAIAGIEAEAPKQKILEPEEVDRCRRILEALGHGRSDRTTTKSGESEDALLALVYESPADDGAREVLADYWLERNDPRGELINLQLKDARGDATEEDAKAIRSLLRAHEKDWLGPIALVTKGRVWRRGFLDEIELQNNAAADPKIWDAAPLDPRLASVRTIRKGKGNEPHYRQFVFSPHARSLRALTAMSKGMLRHICDASQRPDGEPWPIEHLSLSFVPDKKTLATIAESELFPNLRELSACVTSGNIGQVIPLLSTFSKKRKHSNIVSLAIIERHWSRERAWMGQWLNAIATPEFAHVEQLAIHWPDRPDRVIARRGSTAEAVEIELVSAHLFYAQDVVPHVKNVERARIRIPDPTSHVSLGRPEMAEIERVFGKTPIELDETWTAAVSGE